MELKHLRSFMVHGSCYMFTVLLSVSVSECHIYHKHIFLPFYFYSAFSLLWHPSHSHQNGTKMLSTAIICSVKCFGLITVVLCFHIGVKIWRSSNRHNPPPHEISRNSSWQCPWYSQIWSLARPKCTTALIPFLASRYAAVSIILLVGSSPNLRPAWCNGPLPLRNQTRSRWLKVLLQQTRPPKQSGQLFLPHDKNSLKCCFFSLTSIGFPPTLLYCIRFPGQSLVFGTDGITGFSTTDCVLLKKER